MPVFLRMKRCIWPWAGQGAGAALAHLQPGILSPGICTLVKHMMQAACYTTSGFRASTAACHQTAAHGLHAEHYADDLEVSLEADMSEAFNVELEDDSAREARSPCTAQSAGLSVEPLRTLSGTVSFGE